MDSHNSTLRLSYWNANGLRHKIHEFNAFLTDNFIHVACLQETMLNPTDNLPSYPNYVIYRNDRTDMNGNRASGGVAIKVLRSLRHNLLPSLRLKLFEAIGIELFLHDNTRIEIWSVYLPSRTSRVEIQLNYKHDINLLTNRRCSYFINGDFNSRHRLWNCARANSAGNLLYQEQSVRHFFVRYPSSPTRFASNPNTLPSTIDLLLTNGLHDTTELETHATDSDHTIVTYDIILNERAIHNNPNFIPLFREANWEKYQECVHQQLSGASLPAQETISTAQVDELICRFVDALSESQKLSVPMVPRTPYAVTLTPEIRSKIKQKNNLRRTSQRYPQFRYLLTPHINQLAKEISDDINLIVNNNFQHKLSEIDNSENNRKLWHTKKFLQKRNRQIPPLIVNDVKLLTPDEKCNALADHYASVNNQNSLEDQQITHTRRVNNRVSRFMNDNPVTVSDSDLADEPEVRSIVRRLKNSKSPGLDKIHNNLLKKLPPIGFIYLVFIINCCLKLSYFPSMWKEAKVIGILKPGKSPSQPISYRPISLLSSVSKVLERVILTRLKRHVEVTNMIPEHQHGFRSGRSTVTQLRRLVDSIKNNLQDRLSTGLVLCDFEKAFDKVWTNGLIYKLIVADTPQYITRILHSFVNNRSLTVYVQNVASRTHSIRYGVPQGAVLSPILYSIFIHDVPVDDSCTLAQFADDTAFFVSSRFSRSIMSSLEKYAKKLHRYFVRWKLPINADKTEAKFFTKRRTRQLPHRELNLFGSEVSWQSDPIKYLGVYLDNRITFHDHVNYVLQKTNLAVRTLYSMFNRKSRLKRDCKLLLYKVAIRPIMTYASPILNNMASRHKKRLQVLQNKLIKMMIDVPWRTSTDLIHDETGMEKLAPLMERLTENFNNAQVANG